jgi:hypothetical protein
MTVNLNQELTKQQKKSPPLFFIAAAQQHFLEKPKPAKAGIDVQNISGLQILILHFAGLQIQQNGVLLKK